MGALVVSRIKVAVDSDTADGVLVLHDGALVAVFACLNEAFYEHDRGSWHLEAGFGMCWAAPATFKTMRAALAWVAERLGLDGEVIGWALTTFHEDR